MAAFGKEFEFFLTKNSGKCRPPDIVAIFRLAQGGHIKRGPLAKDRCLGQGFLCFRGSGRLKNCSGDLQNFSK